jgi:hypothetical protein
MQQSLLDEVDVFGLRRVRDRRGSCRITANARVDWCGERRIQKGSQARAGQRDALLRDPRRRRLVGIGQGEGAGACTDGRLIDNGFCDLEAFGGPDIFIP